jgi:excisionase family DNA binding protein
MLCSNTPTANEGRRPERLALTYSETAKSLGVCERVVWQLVKDGKLRAVRIGRSVRIPVQELNQFVADRSQSVDAKGGAV